MSDDFNSKDNFNHKTNAGWGCQKLQLIKIIKYKTLHIHGQPTE